MYYGSNVFPACPGQTTFSNIPFTSNTFLTGYKILVGGIVTNVMNGMQYFRLRLLDDENLAFDNPLTDLIFEEASNFKLKKFNKFVVRDIYLDFGMISGTTIPNLFTPTNPATISSTTNLDKPNGVFTCGPG